MMTLYRSVDECPKLPLKQHVEELWALEEERDSGPPGEYMVDAFNRMGKEKFVRIIELRDMVVNPQVFCDSQAQLLSQVGNNQYLVSIMVPDDMVFLHKVILEEAVVAGEHFIENAGNYAFSGTELSTNYKNWRYTVLDMHSEKPANCPVY